MANPLRILVVGHSRDIVDSLQQVLRRQSNIKSASRLLTNGHVDPLHGVRELPDVLMLQMSHNWEDELEALNVRPPRLRPTVLAIGPSDDPNLLRGAMKTGVRDFLSVPIDPAEVGAALEKIQQEKRSTHSSITQRTTVVLNAKGGAGATLIASNISHIMAQELGLKAALVDLNLQFGTSALCLNLTPKVGITDALNAVHEIDSVALRGYMTRHDSGLDLLASSPHPLIEPVSASRDQLEQLLTVIEQNYDHTVIDAHRSIDPLSLAALERADRILLVMQQHLSHLHDAKRMVGALRGYRDDLDRSLTVVINRFHKKASVGIRDIEQALRTEFHVRIPNDYKRVCQTEDLGVPLYTHAASAPITKALRNLARNLSGAAPARKGLFKRMFAQQQPMQ